MEKLEPVCTTDGYVKGCNCCGKQHGSRSKRVNIDYYMTQQFHF